MYVHHARLGRDLHAAGACLGFCRPRNQSLFVFGASGALPVFEAGRWWTLLSASWLHGSLLHILFNVMWIRQLAPDVGELYGPGRMVIIYTVAGVLGFARQFDRRGVPRASCRSPLSGARFTVGASAAIFGLLGALVYYGRRTGSRHVHGQALSWAAMMFVFGLIMPGVDNYAHAGGFIGGYLTARVLDPLKPEQIEHICDRRRLPRVVRSVDSGLCRCTPSCAFR